MRSVVRGSSTSDCYFDLRDLADLGGHGLVGGAAGYQSAQRPCARRREEAELASRGCRHLRGELASAVEKPHVADDRHAVTSHDALDHCFLASVDPDRQSTCDGPAHQPSAPSEIGTPTSEPYSVQEP